MIALLQNEFVLRRKWISEEEFLEIIAIAESTPGPIAVNSATYIGYKMHGVLGSAVSTLGVILPSFTIIFIITLFFDKFLKFKLVQFAFSGIQICVVYLIFNAGLKMLKTLKAGVFGRIIFTAVLAVFIAFSLFAVKFSTIYYILVCGGIGVLLYLVKTIAGKEAKK